jgi:phosphomannomutase
MAVPAEGAAGGIIITASHNPQEWNALKLLNASGEFISAEEGEAVLKLADSQDIQFAAVNKLGNVSSANYLQHHIQAVIGYELVSKRAVAARKFKIVVDGINSSGALYVPALLKALGVEEVTVINETVNGQFAHNPEPLPEHLTAISNLVVKQKADLGIVVDPDVDRLCFVCEDGSMFGEEYTLVAIADFVLRQRKGPAVSNLSSTKALKELAEKHHCPYYPSAVGEVNVVKKMKETMAVVGGEGNGGIIIPDFHYGRDALIGIGLFLTHLAKSKKTATGLRRLYPDYFISKKKIDLDEKVDMEKLLKGIAGKYRNHPINVEDGLKIHFDNDWVHLRSSNTEPIMRIYSESDLESKANNIANKLIADIREFL